MKPTTHYDQDGYKTSEGCYLDNNRPYGPWIFWYHDGTVMQIGAYGEDGMTTGRWTLYWQNGQKQHEGNYRHGQKVGVWSSWHEGGDLQSQGEYRDGYRTGFWQYWSNNGELSSDGEYKNGQRHGRWRFHLETPANTFETEWYLGQLTNRPGQAPEQPQKDRDFYYPVVPGQLADFETPFDRAGLTSDLYFGCLGGGSRFTYLFKPVNPITYHDAGGLLLAIWERYKYLWVLEKRFTASPDEDRAAKIKYPPGRPKKIQQRFMVMVEPHRKARRQKFPASEHRTLREAIEKAQTLAQRIKAQVVVGRFIQDYPLDI